MSEIQLEKVLNILDFFMYNKNNHKCAGFDAA